MANTHAFVANYTKNCRAIIYANVNKFSFGLKFGIKKQPNENLIALAYV